MLKPCRYVYKFVCDPDFLFLSPIKESLQYPQQENTTYKGPIKSHDYKQVDLDSPFIGDVKYEVERNYFCSQKKHADCAKEMQKQKISMKKTAKCMKKTG